MLDLVGNPEERFSQNEAHLLGMVDRCLLPIEAAPRSTLASHTFFRGEVSPSPTESRRASCQLMVKEWALNTGKLPPGGLPRNSAVK